MTGKGGGVGGKAHISSCSPLSGGELSPLGLFFPADTYAASLNIFIVRDNLKSVQNHHLMISFAL